MAGEDRYSRLKQALGCGTDIFDGIWPDMLSSQEINLACAVGDQPFMVRQAAALMDMDEGAALLLLQESYRRGVVDIVSSTPPSYRFSGLYAMFDYFVMLDPARWNAYPQELRAAAEQWYFGEYGQRVEERRNSDEPPTEIVLPLEEAIAYIEAQPGEWYVFPCDCRAVAGGLHGCAHSLNVCLESSSAPANSRAARGLGRKISRDQAIRILREADQEGLIHSPAGTHFCNCCADCCYPLRYSRQAGYEREWPQPLLVAFITAECVGCGRCVKRCPFAAIRLEDKKARVDGTLCVGCGVCRVGCQKQAIKLEGIISDL